MPVGGTIFIAAVVILADMYALSIEVCLVALLLFVLIYFIYFRFAPRQGMGVLLTPICFRLNIPYVIPVGMGLLEEAYSVFAVICGTVVYFFLDGVRQNEKLLGSAAEESAEANSKIVVALNQLLGNKEMYLVIGIMAVTLIIVYLIRRMSIANAWQIAIASGILFETIGLIAGYMLLGISGKTVSVLVGNVISLLIAFVIQFLFFNLDYSRTERLQFEDDEYYYYVKAIPKISVTAPEKTVKHINERKETGEIAGAEPERRPRPKSGQTEKPAVRKKKTASKVKRPKSPAVQRSTRVGGNTDEILLAQSLKEELDIQSIVENELNSDNK